MRQLIFEVFDKDGVSNKLELTVKKNCIIGFAGREIEKTMEHIRELEAIGVPAPKNIPTIYTCSTSTLTQDASISVIGSKSSGEVEFILLKHHGRIYVGIGSDHTDRAMESYSVSKSKGVCEKPVGTVLWEYEDVKDHWDDLEMRSWYRQDEHSDEVLYQEGTAESILPLDKLMEAAERDYPDIEDCIIFSGTVPLKVGMVYGTHFRAEIRDLKLGRKLELEYDVEFLPD